MQIADNTVVSLDYTLKDDQGVTLDTSSNGYTALSLIANLQGAYGGGMVEGIDIVRIVGNPAQ